MPYPPATIEDYERLAQDANCEILHTYRDLPPDTDVPALWRDKKTGEVFSRSYHHMRQRLTEGLSGSSSATYLDKFWDDYRLVAEYLNIELLFDPNRDPWPTDTSSPVKWRGRTGQVIAASLKQIAYGDQQMPKFVRRVLGIPETESLVSLAVLRERVPNE